MRNPLDRLQKVRSTAKLAERRLIDYMIKNNSAMERMTIAELAEGADVSYATVCRLCKKLGYAGIKALKADLAAYTQHNRDTFETKKSKFDMSQSYTTQEICKRVCELSTAIIEDFQQMVDPSQIEKAADALLSAKSIYFIGLGTSAVSARYAYTKLFRLGIPCAIDADSTMIKMKAALMGAGDVLFAVSSSGRTKTILEAAQIAKGNGATIISLCDFAISPLTRLTSVSLFTTARDTSLFLQDEFPLIYGQITIIDILHASCFSRAYDRAQRQFILTKDTARSEKVPR